LGRFVQADTIVPAAIQGVLAWDRYAGLNNNPLKYNDPTGNFAWLPILIGIGAVVGAGIDYGSQVHANYQANGGNLGAALTTNIDLGSIGKSAIAGSAIGLSAGVLGPAVLAVAGEALTGAGLVTGSTTVFSAGLSATEASAALGAAIFGGSTATSILNNRGEPYPKVEVPYYGKVPFPKGAQFTPPGLRVPRSSTYRSNYIDHWNALEKPVPIGGWENYRIHHIQPLEYGGTNDVNNLVHLTRPQHDLFTEWWAGGYGPK
jgi:hypothetical protein